jgi:hypothetical protein
MSYSYQIKKRYLTDTEKDCLLGGDEVVSNLSPRELQYLWCADFQFPNDDTFVLRPEVIYLTSAIAI